MNNKDYAIMIGIQHYVANNELGGPHKDTNDFKDWLKDTNGGDVPEVNIVTFLSTPQFTPTQTEIDRWLGSTISTLQAGQRGRRLYFYFSGHGIGVNAMSSAMLLPEWTTVMRNFALSSEKYLQQLVNSAIFEEIIFIMDCCRNRIPGVEGQPPLWGAVMPSPLKTETLMYYACEFENPSFETPLIANNYSLDNLLPRGIFTKVLLDGLKGAAANNDGWVRVQDLVNYMTRKLPVVAKAVGKNQNPRSRIEIDLRKKIAGPFPKTITIEIEFKNSGIDMILEDADVEEVKTGSSSDGKWQLELKRGEYVLRKKEDQDGMHFFNDGTQTHFIYE